MDLEQAKDETLREPERAQGKPDTDRPRQPSEHVASAVSMAGQVAQQLCPDAGRVALFVARFANDLRWRRAIRVGMRWSWAEKAALKASGDFGGRLTPEPAGNTRLQTKAFQEAGRIVRIRGLALCRQRRPRGRSQQAPGGRPLVTAVRAGRALSKQPHLRGRRWAVLPARAHRAQCQAARRLSARHVAASVLVPAAPPTAAAA